MASYQELIQASSDSDLVSKVMVACVVAADVIRANGSATTNQKAWAAKVFADPPGAMREVLWSVLAQNKAQPLATILAANDGAVQTAVDAVVPLLTR